MDLYYCLAARAAFTALLAAVIFARQVTVRAEGTKWMKEITMTTWDGANALLRVEYKILAIFIVVVFAVTITVAGLLGVAALLIGTVSSILASSSGMNIVAHVNVRTANAAKEYGIRRALVIASSGGAVTGFTIAGLGLLDIGMLYYLACDPNILFDYSPGASLIALFVRIGGGIYTKVADVGADLVGKVETGTPENDPHNPTVTVDNVGDDVGDMAGMGADLLEPYSTSTVFAISPGPTVSGREGVLSSLLLAVVGIPASVIGVVLVRLSKYPDPKHVFDGGTYFAGGAVMAGALPLS